MTTEAEASARALLKNVAIFAHLDDAALGSIARLVETREFPEGAVIVSQDEPGDSLFVLARGRVKVVLFGESGREIILSMFKTPGDFFGEMSLLDEGPRSASVVALEPSSFLVLSRSGFQAHLEAHPRTALAVLAEMSRRLRRADGIIGNLALLDVFGRVARKLRDMAEAEGEETEGGILIRERPTQQELADMLGTSRETVSRALSELARRGLVVMSGKRILLRREFLESSGEAADH
jgi:CRP/FNR family cyclic AMP-dependent transcriptional regulator